MLGLSWMSQHIDYVVLVFLRLSGLFLTSPVFGRKEVPAASKIGLCGVLTVVFLAVSPVPQAALAYRGFLGFGLLCLRELLLGGAMGFVLTAMFGITLTAGSIMDYQIGFSMASIYDAQNNVQAPVSGSLLNLMLLLILFGCDGHLKLIEILYRTLEAIPVGTPAAAPDILWAAAEIMSKSFVLAVMVAMPMVGIGLMAEIILGATIRTVPQMNMFVVGIPLKIILGLTMLALTFTVFADFSKTILSRMFDYIDTMFRYLGSVS